MAEADVQAAREALKTYDADTSRQNWDRLRESVQNILTLENLRLLLADKERLDWLEARINEDGEIHLHDGKHPHGNGLGLRPGRMVRTLRDAIDTAMQPAEIARAADAGGKEGNP